MPLNDKSSCCEKGAGASLTKGSLHRLLHVHVVWLAWKRQLATEPSYVEAKLSGARAGLWFCVRLTASDS